MEDIERSGPKTDFSPWSLGGEGEGSHGGEGPWGATLLTLGQSGHQRREFWRGGHRLGSEKRSPRRKTMVEGLNTLGHTPGRTLSGQDSLSIERQQTGNLEEFELCGL
jgi:hypothetical protein